MALAVPARCSLTLLTYGIVIIIIFRMIQYITPFVECAHTRGLATFDSKRQFIIGST